MRSVISFFFAGLALLIFAQRASAQTATTGDVTGLALDSAGAAVVNAEITLKSVDTSEPRRARSGSEGLYRFTFVRPGKYQLSASTPDLRSETLEVLVNIGQVASANLVMKVQGNREVVTVTDTASTIDKDDAHIAYVLSPHELETLPLPGGDLVAVAYTAPGVVVATKLGSGNFASSGIGSVSNLFTVNGADDMEPYNNVNNSGTTGMLLGVNEVQQASVIQNAYDAQFGRQAGAQVNYVTKSGTNAYHGDLSYSYNGTALNANDFFSNATGLPREHQVSNQYAAAFGGPIIHDKLFFFLDTEGIHFALPGSGSVVSVPSQAFENYALKTVLPSQVPLYQQAFALYNSAPGRNNAVPVTNGNGPLQDSFGAMGCGALAGTPAGNGGTFGVNVSCADAYSVNISSQTSEWLASSRMDYNLSNRQSLYIRFKTDQGFLPVEPNPINPVFNVISTQPDYEGQLHYTFAITPRLVVDFIGSASWYNYLFTAADFAGAVKAFPFRINIFDGGANGSGGITSIGVPAVFPQGIRAGQIQIVNDVSYITGKHLLKVGLNYRHNQESDLNNQPLTDIGRFTIFGLDEFASGAINPASGSRYAQNFTDTQVLHIRLYNLGVYAQDEWSITPQFKLTAGVRFDRNGNPSCVDNCFTLLNAPFPDVTKGLNIPYNASIQTGLSHAFYKVEPVIVQPRVSFAYSPEWSKQTVLRGGVGLFSDLYPAFLASLIATNAPNLFSSSIRQGMIATSGSGSAPAIAAATASAFQNGFASGATLSQLQQAVAPATFSAPSYFSIPAELRSPKYLEWSLEVEHQMWTKNVIGIRYTGNYGYDAFVTNEGLNASVQTARFPDGFGGLPVATPDPRFSFVEQLTNAGFSNYNGMTLFARRKVGLGFQGQISYTWSHSLDTLSNGGISKFAYDSTFVNQLNPFNLSSLNYSSSDYDVRQNLTGDFVWDLPAKFRRRELKAFLGGWSLSGKLYVHTGLPFSVVDSRLLGLVSPNLGGSMLAALVNQDVPAHCGSAAVNTPCFTTSAFATAATQTTFGNVPRNSFRGPGYFDVDSALYKTISVNERIRLRLGINAYNLFNHPNFADPNSDVSLSGFGLITFTLPAPSGPYGQHGGPDARAVLLTGRLDF